MSHEVVIIGHTNSLIENIYQKNKEPIEIEKYYRRITIHCHNYNLYCSYNACDSNDGNTEAAKNDALNEHFKNFPNCVNLIVNQN